MKRTLILLFSITFLFTACNRNKDDEPTPTTPVSMDDLEISSGFDWKTINDYQLTLTGNTNSIVEVTSDENIPYQKAFLTANVPYTMKLTVPSYEKSVRLKYLGQNIVLDLSSETLSYTFE